MHFSLARGLSDIRPVLPRQFRAVRMNYGTPDHLGAPGDKVKMFLCRPGRRQEVLDRNLAIRESAKTTPWPPPSYLCQRARPAGGSR